MAPPPPQPIPPTGAPDPKSAPVPAPSPSIQVGVRHGLTGRPIGGADVVMDGGTPPTQRRRTQRDGRPARFEIACSEDVTFWAEVLNDASFPNPSPTVACQSLITLKLYPNRRPQR